MDSAEHNFGLVGTVEPESLGVPGKRVFRLLIDGASPAAATLWLEKEQLYGLSMAVKSLLENGPWNKKDEDPEAPGAVPFLEDPEILEGSSREILEFKVGRLGLAIGPGKDHLTIFFHDELEESSEETFVEEDFDDEEEESEAEPVGRARLQISMKVDQSEGFVKKSLDLCASGRGVDAVSRQAMVASGKVDPHTNGHFKH